MNTTFFTCCDLFPDTFYAASRIDADGLITRALQREALTVAAMLLDPKSAYAAEFKKEALSKPDIPGAKRVMRVRVAVETYDVPPPDDEEKKS